MRRRWANEAALSTRNRPGASRNLIRLSAAGMLAIAAVAIPVSAQQTQDLHRGFLTPPDDAKPMVRWWWFGPAVTAGEIRKEIDQMHAGGFGGFELASVYPLAVDDPARGIKNLRYTSPAMVGMLRVAQQHGRELGMRVDLTLGSGWPFGGPHIPLELAAERLKVIAVAQTDAAFPTLEPGERMIAMFKARGTPEHWVDPHIVWDYSVPHTLGTYDYVGPIPGQVSIYFIASHTKQMVKRAAVGGEGYVLDHMNRAAIDVHDREVSDKLLQGFAGNAPPYAIFSDSLEVYGSDWTGALPAEFKRRRGYNLIPHLAELWQGGTPQAEAVRHDWGVTLSELVRENYLQPLADYATAHRTKFRSQTYGEPAATLIDEMTPQLAEGEGPQWNQFSFTRWASSANHLFGRNVTSAETWTWLHSPAFRATPLDMKVEADRMFLQGVNQVIGHGWPYSPPFAQESGYSLYAAAVFNAHNPWWPVMPAVTNYVQRVSWLMRQGQPANDVAILLPEDDAQAAFAPGHVSVTEGMKQRITPELMRAVLQSGHNLDYVDGPALEQVTLHSKVLVVPPTTRMPLREAQAIAAYQQRGGRVIFVGTVPSIAPGMQDAHDTPALNTLIGSIERTADRTTIAGLSDALHALLPAAFDVSSTNGAVGFIQRSLPECDVYFVANTTPEPKTFPLHVSSVHRTLAWWDIDSSATSSAVDGETVTLPPYGSRILVASDVAASRLRVAPQHTVSTVTLGKWRVRFPGSPSSPAVASHAADNLDWTAETSTKFYSGRVDYSTRFALQSGRRESVQLRFATGTALPDTQPATKPGIRAWYDAPVREAATVFVNGKEAGVLWHPPYTLDLTGLTHAGENTLEIRVYNTAINALAGQPPRDYTALKAKYGDRFQMQDMTDLQPDSSGIFGAVEIVTLAPGKE